MMDITQAFFDRLAQRSYEPLLPMATGSIRLDIQGSGKLARHHEGWLKVSREMASADCVAGCRKEDFERMVVGTQNPSTLYL